MPSWRDDRAELVWSRSVMVVEDEEFLRELLVRAIRREGYEVEGAGTAAEALQLASRRAFDVVITDWVLPDSKGPGLIRALRKAGVCARFVVVSGYAGSFDLDLLAELGVDAVLAKPAEMREIIEAIGDLVPISGQEAGK